MWVNADGLEHAVNGMLMQLKGNTDTNNQHWVSHAYPDGFFFDNTEFSHFELDKFEYWIPIKKSIRIGSEEYETLQSILN